MVKQLIFYPESKFGGFTDIDGTMAFYNRVNALINRDSVVLDVGCGRGSYAEDPIPIRRNLRILKGKVKTVIGIDVNSSAEQNPFIDTFYHINTEKWPVPDNSADLIISDNVLEHISSPEKFFSEVCRVLKAGGHICIRTPNAWSYIALISRVIPNMFHAKVLKKAQVNTNEEDVFPTLYRCNSVRKLKAVLNKYGFEYTVYCYEAEPSYLSFSKFAYWLGVLHQRFAPRFLKPAIFAFGKLNKIRS
ncbi:MAG: class I SAM-dependent methyltransferase [Nitrospiraceae bacterium]|nr:MAG: class I SAM-dependent methyltransferase [Nitrospiraceae bacterium]